MALKLALLNIILLTTLTKCLLAEVNISPTFISADQDVKLPYFHAGKCQHITALKDNNSMNIILTISKKIIVEYLCTYKFSYLGNKRWSIGNCPILCIVFIS